MKKKYSAVWEFFIYAYPSICVAVGLLVEEVFWRPYYDWLWAQSHAFRNIWDVVVIVAIAVAVLFAIIGAAKLRLFRFQEDSSYVSGSHYEITIDSDGKGTAKEVNDYSGGGEWILNIIIFFIRLWVVGLAGWLVFLIRYIIHLVLQRRAKKEEI